MSMNWLQLWGTFALKKQIFRFCLFVFLIPISLYDTFNFMRLSHFHSLQCDLNDWVLKCVCMGSEFHGHEHTAILLFYEICSFLGNMYRISWQWTRHSIGLKWQCWQNHCHQGMRILTGIDVYHREDKL